MENSLRAAVRDVDPQLPVREMQTMERVISNSEAPRLFNTVLISASATIALLLAVLGIYGVIAFSVALRLLAATAVSHLLRSFLFGISPFFPRRAQRR
jgi:hypothetical protein